MLAVHFVKHGAQALQRFVSVGRGARQRRGEQNGSVGGRARPPSGLLRADDGAGFCCERACTSCGGQVFGQAGWVALFARPVARVWRSGSVVEPVVHDQAWSLGFRKQRQPAGGAPGRVHLAQVRHRDRVRVAGDDLVRALDLHHRALAGLGEEDVGPGRVEYAEDSLVLVQGEPGARVRYRIGGASSESGCSGVLQRITRRISVRSAGSAALYV